MIFTLLLNTLFVGLGSVLSLWPAVTAGTIPFNLGTTVPLYAGYVFAFAVVFWPIQPILACLLAYIPIKLSLVVMRFVLGSRMPKVRD